MKIDTVSARGKLKARGEPYWQKLTIGRYLGFRRTQSGGTWIARANIDGSQKYKALGEFHELPENLKFDAAQKMASEWFSHISQGGCLEEITVAEACQRYVDKLKGEKREIAARDAEARFKRWVYTNRKLSLTPIHKLKSNQIDEWKVKMSNEPIIHQNKNKKSNEPRSASTINRDMNTFRAALNLAKQDGYVMNDSAWAQKLKPLKGVKTMRDIYLNETERRNLLNFCPPDFAKFVKALCLCPLRPGPISNLKVSDFEERLNVLKIIKDKKDKPKLIKIQNSLKEHISECCIGKLKEDLIFTNSDGKKWTKDSWKKPFKHAAIQAGLDDKTVLYNLRHSLITDLIVLHQLDAMTVARISGTSMAMIDAHYGHLIEQHATTALDKIKV